MRWGLRASGGASCHGRIRNCRAEDCESDRRICSTFGRTARPDARQPARAGGHARGHRAHRRRRGLLEFKPLYGAATVCAQAAIDGHAVGFITNNGPIDVAGANKATHFIQRMCQLGHPIIYLQNTTGYMVGKESEQGGMIKHGSKMIQAVTNATVPQITIQCGASFGAGNYGMCGRGYAPRFLFSWPSAKTAVMGGEQAARTMQIVTDAGLARKGIAPDPSSRRRSSSKIVAMFEAQADAFYTSGLLAGRRRDRPARHARGAGVLPGHLRGSGARIRADAVRRGKDVCRQMKFTHEHLEIQKTLKRFIDEEVNPHVEEWEAAIFPAHQVFKRLGKLGLLGLTKPEAYGGAALDYSYAMAMAEALGHTHCGGVPMAIGVQTDMATPALARFGSDELRRQFLAPAIAGDMVACIGVIHSQLPLFCREIWSVVNTHTMLVADRPAMFDDHLTGSGFDICPALQCFIRVRRPAPEIGNVTTGAFFIEMRQVGEDQDLLLFLLHAASNCGFYFAHAFQNGAPTQASFKSVKCITCFPECVAQVRC